MDKQNYTLFGLFDLLHPDMTKEEINYVINYLVKLKIQDGYLADTNIKIFTDKYHYIKELISDKELLKTAIPSAMYREDITYKEVRDYFDRINLFDSSISFKRLIYISQDDTINIGTLLSSVNHELEHIYQFQNGISDNITYYEYEYYFMPDSVKKTIASKFDDKKANDIEEFFEILKSQYFNHYYDRSYVEHSAFATGTLHLGINMLRYLEEKEDLPLAKRMWLFKEIKHIYEDDFKCSDAIKEAGTGLSREEYPVVRYNMLKVLSVVDRNQEAQEFMDVLCGLTSYARLGKEFKTDFIKMFNLKFYSTQNEDDINNLITRYYLENNKPNPELKEIKEEIDTRIELLKAEKEVTNNNQEDNIDKINVENTTHTIIQADDNVSAIAD